MPKVENQDVTIISINKPTIKIELKKKETCKIIGLKLSHSGNKQE